MISILEATCFKKMYKGSFRPFLSRRTQYIRCNIDAIVATFRDRVQHATERDTKVDFQVVCRYFVYSHAV